MSTNAARDEEIVRLFSDDNRSVTDLAKEFRLSPNRIEKIVRKGGGTKPFELTKKGRPKIDDMAIVSPIHAKLGSKLQLHLIVNKEIDERQMAAELGMSDHQFRAFKRGRFNCTLMQFTSALQLLKIDDVSELMVLVKGAIEKREAQ